MDFREAQLVVANHAPNDYYVEHYRSMEQMYLPALFRTLEKTSPRRILEIGPGWGTTAVWLSEKGHDVTVMDLMPIGTFVTRSLMDDYGVTYVQADIEDSPGPVDGTFDLVIMTQVIPHLAWRPDRALHHVGRLMHPDGELVASVLDRRDYRSLDATFGDDWTAVPEWGTAERCEDIVKCMYSKKTFTALLHTEFRSVEVWKPRRSSVLFARARH